MKPLITCIATLMLSTSSLSSHDLGKYDETRYYKNDRLYYENFDYIGSLLRTLEEDSETYSLSISSKNSNFKARIKLDPDPRHSLQIEKITKVGLCEQKAHKNYLVVDLRQSYRGEIWGVSYERLFFDLESGRLLARFYDVRSSQMGGLFPAEQLFWLYDIDCENDLKFTEKPAEVFIDGGIIPPPLK
ncbi:hypothetical protein [Lentilitoribacter sp. Alg239-R112]|uniref:hypothetical protein n=1 Tax=Lentilitoribacter sp. Alg239-R112 TaxID=2305987 RepID=UPI0013A68BFF|nr:hypothetical protein [Lentilitoribacter sp. Alg239-R112]